MGLYADRVFPFLLDHSEPREMAEQRRLALRDVRGDVLEIGIGSGANVPYYPEDVRTLTAVEPSDAMRPRATRKAEARGLAVTWHRGRGEALPLGDGCVDSVVLVDVLCSVDDVDAVLAAGRPGTQTRRPASLSGARAGAGGRDQEMAVPPERPEQGHGLRL